jgi:hypothetical protein
MNTFHPGRLKSFRERETKLWFELTHSIKKKLSQHVKDYEFIEIKVTI